MKTLTELKEEFIIIGLDEICAKGVYDLCVRNGNEISDPLNMNPTFELKGDMQEKILDVFNTAPKYFKNAGCIIINKFDLWFKIDYKNQESHYRITVSKQKLEK